MWVSSLLNGRLRVAIHSMSSLLAMAIRAGRGMVLGSLMVVDLTLLGMAPSVKGYFWGFSDGLFGGKAPVSIAQHMRGDTRKSS